MTYYLRNYRTDRFEILLSRAWRKAFFRVSYRADFKAGDILSLHDQYFICRKSRQGKNCRLVYYQVVEDSLRIIELIDDMKKALTK